MLFRSDADDVIEWADKMTQRLREDHRLRDVASEAQEGGLRLQVEVDRERAGRLGVSMQAVNDTLNNAFGQRQISTIYSQANQYRVILEADPRYQRDPNSLANLYVTGAASNSASATTAVSATSSASAASNQIPLSSIARIEYISAPLAIAHQDQFPSVTISFNLSDRKSTRLNSSH